MFYVKLVFFMDDVDEARRGFTGSGNIIYVVLRGFCLVLFKPHVVAENIYKNIL